MKNLLLFLGSFLLCGILFAQTGFHIGFMGGPQYTRMFGHEDFVQGRNNLEYETTWGYNMMGKIGYNIGDPLGFHLGVIYSQQGHNSSSLDSSSGLRITTEQRVNYIKIPLYLHLNSDPAPVMFAFEIGPQLGLLQTVEITDNGQALILNTPAEQLYKPNDLSFAWSLGLEFQVAPWMHLVLTHRGDYSILDIEEKDIIFNAFSFDDTGRSSVKNGTFSIQAGLIFCLAPSGGGRNTKFWIR